MSLGAKKEANVIRRRIQGRVPERNQRGRQQAESPACRAQQGEAGRSPPGQWGGHEGGEDRE